MVGGILISHDHFLDLKIASVDPYELKNVSAAFRQLLYSMTFWGSLGRFKFSGNFVKWNICWDPLNLISSRLIAGNVFKNAVDIARKISNGFETLVFFWAAPMLPKCCWGLKFALLYGTVPTVEISAGLGTLPGSGVRVTSYWGVEPDCVEIGSITWRRSTASETAS